MVSMRERGSWNTKRRSRRDGKTRRRGFSDRPLRREPKPKKGSPSLSLYFAFAFPLSEFFALNKKKKNRHRQAELVHCRWAMLGVAGVLGQEVRYKNGRATEGIGEGETSVSLFFFFSDRRSPSLSRSTSKKKKIKKKKKKNSSSSPTSGSTTPPSPRTCPSRPSSAGPRARSTSAECSPGR